MKTLDRIKQVIELEISGLQNIVINSNFEKAVDIIYNCKGKVILCGMGKAGIIGKKIAATFSSTGTPAIFLHPGEAQHGDLGIVSKGDIIILLSNSGKTKEVLQTLNLLRKLLNTYIIAITSDNESKLANAADLVLLTGKSKEACSLGLAPTTSTTVMLAIGDALAMAVMDLKDFSLEDYALRHHSGYLSILAKEKIKKKNEGNN